MSSSRKRAAIMRAQAETERLRAEAEQARERQRQAEEAIYGDPFVRELIDNFGASVDPASIRPKDL